MSFMSPPASWAEGQPAPAFTAASELAEGWAPLMQAWASWWATPISLWQPPAEWAKPWLDMKWADPSTLQWPPLMQTLAWPFAAAAENTALPADAKPAVATPKAATVTVLPVVKAPARKPLAKAGGANITAFKPAANKAAQTKSAPIAKPAKPDDLTIIEGIGPKIAAKLAEAGIKHFATLAAAPTKRLSSILEAAGPRFKLARPDTWAEQAKLLARGETAAFEKLTQELRAGLRA